MLFRLEGSYFEACSCDLVCSCSNPRDGRATHDRCEMVAVFRIERGEVQGIDVRNLTVVLVVDAPAVMREGGWRVGMFVDAAASDAQAEALIAVFSGELGGPAATVLAPLVGERIGVARAPIFVIDQGWSRTIRVGGAIALEVADVVPFGPRSAGPATDQPIFEVDPDVMVAYATRSRINAFGISYAATSGFSAPFAWAA
jgi:hypothetical protein